MKPYRYFFQKMPSYLLFLFFLYSILLGAKLPEIGPRDVSEILQQMMEAHVSYKKLTPVLVKRTLEEYLDELDPTKTYLLGSEIAFWTSPSEVFLENLVADLEKSDFSEFSKIHEKMIQAISRRGEIEKEIAKAVLPSDVSYKEFKDLKWSKNVDDLKERLLRIKALQVKTAEKLTDESKDKALRRIAKRRSIREEEILSSSSKEKDPFILSNVLKALASSFDAHTAYFTPGEASQFMIQVQQRLFGVGAQLRDDLNGFTIVKIIEGGPASRTALKANDRVIAIDEEPVVGMEITDAVELIRGEEGTSVKLTVLREEEDKTLDIEIIRGEVVIKEARLESEVIPFGDGIIAHISLHAFYQDPQHTSAGDLYEEIAKIRKEHKIKGIVLDLRHNSGGVLPQAVSVSGLFITKGIVVSIKDNQGHIEHLRDIDGKTAWDGPLVILTSKLSASAAEIVAQTLQDYGRAIVVGDPHTYGKGSFQTFTLDATTQGKVNPKGEYKVTRGRYYTVSGKSPQLVGVQPDILIPGPYSAMEIGEKYSKYPLENDEIAENFSDDLSDIPPYQREQISWLYRFNLQQRIRIYNRYLPILKHNAEVRIKEDKLYQRFLSDLDKEEIENPILEFYAKGDLQLKEAVNVMKDLIVLLN